MVAVAASSHQQQHQQQQSKFDSIGVLIGFPKGRSSLRGLLLQLLLRRFRHEIRWCFASLPNRTELGGVLPFRLCFEKGVCSSSGSTSSSSTRSRSTNIRSSNNNINNNNNSNNNNSNNNKKNKNKNNREEGGGGRE